jgi:iron complex outermembrane receptor protein
MKNWFLTSVALGALAAVVGAGAPALAQTAAPARASSDTLGEVVVTARRVTERLQDVPISITVYSQAQLDQRNIVNPTDLAIYTPSLTTSQRYGAEKSSFVIRGFTQEQATAPSVGVYFADVVAPRAMGGTVGGATALPGAFFDLQNVQVLKGPQGTLFGRNTTGGAVLLVPQRPTDRQEGYLEAQGGNYSMWRAQGVLNVPLSDQVRMRVGFDRMQRDGYIDNKSGIGPSDYNNVDYFAARASLVVDLTPDLENYTILSYNHSFGNGYSARMAVCNNPAAPLNPLLGQLACAQIARQAKRGDSLLDVENTNPNPYLDIRQWQAINTTTWHVNDDLTIKNIASYADFRERDSFSLYGENFTLGGRPFNYILLNTGSRGGPAAAQSTFTEELQFQGRAIDDRLNWQAGAYFELSDPIGFSETDTAILLSCADVRTRQCSNPLGIGAISASSTKTYFHDKGFYAQGVYKLTDQLSLTGGIRYTIDNTKATGRNTRELVARTGGVTGIVCSDSVRFRNPDGSFPKVVADRSQCANTIEIESQKPTWLLDLDYKPTQDVLLYGKWARGYRAGGINMTNIGIETWNPEKVDTYEIGAKTTLRGSIPGYFNIAAFYNNFTDQQITANLVANPTSGVAGGNAIVNAGKSKIWGVELDASIRPFEPFTLDLGYAYLNTKLEAITPPALPPSSPYIRIIPTAVVGDELSYSPKNRVTLTGTYRLPLDPALGDFSVAATFVHTDAQNATASIVTPIYRLPATDLLNLNFDWRNVHGHPVDFSIFATNVTNQIYPVGVGSAWQSAGFDGYLMGPPRMVGARLRYRFGAE